jgi:ActR/RegA family two-component response regulator
MTPPRLLFVDDESGIRLTLSAILHQNGFDVTVAASVPEALALIGKNRYEVLLSDLNIGEPGDGFTVVSAMRRSQPQAATFILTGYPDFESALLAIRNQVDDYFTKPADVKTLVSTITKRLAQDTGSPEAVPLRRVSDILREHAESICDEWLRAVGENGDLSRVQLTTEERTDHVPAVLQELIGRVERDSADTSQQAVSAAEEHGRVRFRQGYTVAQVVLEARLLQRSVTSNVQANLLGVDLSTLIVDLVEIGESLASLLEISIRAFQEESQARPRNSSGRPE